MEELSIEEKARRYDEIMAKRSEAAKKSNENRSEDARKESARKAVETRWNNKKDEWLSEHDCELLIQETEIGEIMWLKFPDGKMAELEKGCLPELAEKYRFWSKIREDKD